MGGKKESEKKKKESKDEAENKEDEAAKEVLGSGSALVGKHLKKKAKKLGQEEALAEARAAAASAK